LSEVETCPVCGRPVSRKNLSSHIRKVHPKRASTLLQPKAETKLSIGRRSRWSKRVIMYALIGVLIVLVSAAAVEFVSTNTLRMHIHPQLSISILGASQIVPANIGIDQNLWKNHSLDHYGVNGGSPVITRDTSGIIHVESNTVRNFTLQEFLAIWGMSIDQNQVVGNPVRPGQSACILVNGIATQPTTDVGFADKENITLAITNAPQCSATS